MVGFRPSLDRVEFGEPPSHPECLEYALEVCPFLGGGDWREFGAEAEGLTVVDRPAGPDRYLAVALVDDVSAFPDPEGSGGYKWKGIGVQGIRWVDRLSA